MVHCDTCTSMYINVQFLDLIISEFTVNDAAVYLDSLPLIKATAPNPLANMILHIKQQFSYKIFIEFH